MTFRKWAVVGCSLICSIMVGWLLFCMPVAASEETVLPAGDILIMYSDGISDEDRDNVLTLVAELTYQSFQVTFAPAEECLGQLQNFSSIICYKVERYPDGLVEELQEREKEGNQILSERKAQGDESGENDIRILVIGNSFMRSYLQKTGRAAGYQDSKQQVGKLQYAFSDQSTMEALVKEEDFLFLTGELDQTAGSLNIDTLAGYFSARKGCLSHIPVTDLTDRLVKAAVSREISLWKWPYNGEPHIYAQYMVLNQVYPFQDPDKLLNIVQYMIDRKQPFVISVMPVYNNGNYPAMQHFCEVLRYAQANGGVILMHSPINQMTEFDVDLMNEYITTAIQIYMDQGVYPMGLQISENWLFDEAAIEIASRFRTVLVADEEDASIKLDETIRTNQVYRDGHQWIAPAIALDADGTSHLQTYSTAVYLDITEDMDIIQRKVQACISSEVPLKSLWDIEHSFWTDEDAMTYRNHIILVNGKRTEAQFTPTEYEEEFQYNRNMLQRFSADLSEENSKLIVAVIIVSVLFLWFILTARHRNKQKFFTKHRGEKRLTKEILPLEKRQENTQIDQKKDDFDITELSEGDDFEIKEKKKNEFDFEVADLDHERSSEDVTG